MPYDSSRPGNARVTIAIQGGEMYTEDGVVLDGQILIDGERIIAVNPVPDPTVTADRVIDATGCIVIPGAIDTHSHHRDPGFTHKEDITSATSAAAVGGVTTSIGMPNVNPPTTTAELYAALIESQSARTVVDFNHNPAPTRLDQIQLMADLGALAFKVYMVVDSKRGYPHMPGLGVHDHGLLLEISQEITRTDRILSVHPNDQAMLDVLERRAWAGGDMSWRNYAHTECGIGGVTWNAAVAVLLELQRVTDVRLNVLHMMNPGMIRLIAEAKRDGRDVTCEVNPFTLFLSDVDRIAPLGPLALGRCVPQEWVAELWQAIADDVIDVVGTDHAPHTRAEKEKGWDNMWETPSGTPQLQHYIPRLLTASKQGLVTVEDVVRTTATNPAKRFGLYPKKGAIRVGAHADIVISNLNDEVVSTDDEVLSKAGYTPYHGETLVGIPRFTLLRGRVIVDSGRLVGEPGYGEHVKPVSEPVLAAELARHSSGLAGTW